MWEVDLIGRIPDHNKSSEFILIAVDHYTKWMETKRLKNKSASEISKCIKELIIDKHGIPKKILSDNGLEFKNEPIINLTKNFNFEWLYSSPRHHETVGGVERANQTLIKILRKITNFGKTSWPNQLENATWAYNISFHRAINTSPYTLKFGASPHLKINGMQDRIHEYSKATLITQRDNHFENYKKAIIKGKRSLKNELEIGDAVLIFDPPLKGKLKEKWHEGFKITRKVDPDAYIVRKNFKEYRVNKKHIKKDLSND